MNNDLFTFEILKNIISNFGNGNNITFIKHFNTFEFKYEKLAEFIAENNSAEYINVTFETKILQEAYEPFLDTIRTMYLKYFAKEYDIEEFISHCNIYPLHRETIFHYLRDGICRRREDFMLPELNYEKSKFEDTIINILNFISKSVRIVFIINRFSNALESTIRLIRKCVENNYKNGIGMVIAYNEAALADDSLKLMIDDLLDIAHSKNMVVDYSVNNKYAIQEKEMPFYPKSYEIEDYIIKINNMLFTAAFWQASFYLRKICSVIEKDEIIVNEEHKIKLFAMNALCLMYTGDYSDSLIKCESAIDVCKSNSRHLFYFKYISALTYMSMLQPSNAYDCALECKRLASNDKNEYLIFKSEIIYHMSRHCGWKNAQINFGNIVTDGFFLEELREKKFFNTLAYFYLYVDDSNYELMRYSATTKTINGHVKKAFSIAKMLSNDYFMIIAYMKIIFTYANKGFHSYVNELYRRRMELISNSSDKLEDELTYDGLGYNCIITEEYDEAQAYFNKSIEKQYNNNYPLGIAETLYNMGFNAISAGDYLKASEYLETVLQIIDFLEISSIQICTTSKLYGYLSLANYYLKNTVRTLYYSQKMHRLLSDFMDKDITEKNYAFWDDEMFLCYLMDALFAKEDENYVDAEYYFERAGFHLMRSPGFMFFSYPLYCSELYDYYKKTNRLQEAQRTLSDGIKYCQINGYLRKSKILTAIGLGQENTFLLSDSMMRNISIEDILLQAKKYGINEKLNKSKRYIGFLSNLHILLESDKESTEKIISKSMFALKDTFFFDELIYVKKINGLFKIVYTNNEVLKNGNIELIMPIIKMILRKKSICHISRQYTDIVSIEKLFECINIDKINTFIGVPIINNGELIALLIGCVCNYGTSKGRKLLFKEQALMTIKASFRQINSRVDYLIQRKNIEKINKKLKRLAINDSLTGLYNRLGLVSFIENNTNEDKLINAVMYIDLDNFKNYNDTYGHDFGDSVLVIFAELLVNYFKENGICIRYGGDEFIVLIKSANENDCKSMIQDFYEYIKHNFSKSVIHKNEKIDNIADLELGCSIGVAFNENLNLTTIEETLSRADKAMYMVKKNNKGQYILDGGNI